jgi:hypothetical protein
MAGEDLLEQAERVLQVKAAQERLPSLFHLSRLRAGAGPPQPHRHGLAVTV